MLKCLIIDDEQSCIDTLRVILEKKFTDEVSVEATTVNPAEAPALIGIHKPDLVFLDVEMPHITGVELLQSLSNIDFQVIFTTAHQHYALQAIKLNALDYLLKPISLDELATAVQKCVTRKQQQSASLISNFLDQMRAGTGGSRKISIASDNTVQFVPVTDIIRIESQSNYSNIHFTSRNKLLIAKTLKEFEEQLLPYNFLRIHHSHLINLEHVIGYKNLDGGYVIMRDKDIIEISRRKKQEVLQRLNSL